MKAKEKAKKLMEKYQFNGDMIDDIRMSEESAIESALICVDEILEANEKISLKDLRETIETNDILCQLTDNAMYWQKVKKEINKI